MNSVILFYVYIIIYLKLFVTRLDWVQLRKKNYFFLVSIAINSRCCFKISVFDALSVVLYHCHAVEFNILFCFSFNLSILFSIDVICSYADSGISNSNFIAHLINLAQSSVSLASTESSYIFIYLSNLD